MEQAGGIAHKDPFLMQTFADVTGRGPTLPASKEIPALAAGQEGGFASLEKAVAAIVKPSAKSFRPDPKAHAGYTF